MRYLALALVLAVTGTATVARSEDAIPDIKGTWTGKGKVLVYGDNAPTIQGRKRWPSRRGCATSK